MELTPKTKLTKLLDEFPFLVDFLAEFNPKLAGIKNPVLRNTLARAANLAKVAGMAGCDLRELLLALQQEIRDHSGMELPINIGDGPLTHEQRQDVLKQIIDDLHAGGDRAELKQRFATLIEDVGASEIGEMEQRLIDAGMPAGDLTRLCDVHMDIFRDQLSQQELPDMPPGHPVATMLKENEAIMERIFRHEALAKGIRDDGSHGEDLVASLKASLAGIKQVENHYLRKENQLFPFLEKHGISGPPKVMWTIHDEIRGLIKSGSRELGQVNDWAGFRQAQQELVTKVSEMVTKENLILIPMALDTLDDQEWLEMRRGEDHIGYSYVEPGNEWPPRELVEQLARESQQSEAGIMANPGGTDGYSSVVLNLETGSITPEQANMLFNHLPVEISFTDENHIVRYFSEGKERIFPRSPGVIGRHVKDCHPPKSVKMVEQILSDFETGQRDVAEFWIQMGGMFIHIRYFALRDRQGRFRGTMEVVQNIAPLRELEGEKRLLD